MTAHTWRSLWTTMALLATSPSDLRADPQSTRALGPSVTHPRVNTPERSVGRPSPHDSITDTTPRDVERTYAPGPQTAVNERITRDLGNGCRYEATLRGDYRGRKRPRGHGFDPNLALRARVLCGGVVRASAPAARIHGRDLTAQQLVSALATHGRVVAPAPVGTCSYTPSFSVSDVRIEPHAVWQVCSTATAMGGGPPARRAHPARAHAR